MAIIFVSHTSADRPWAEWIAWTLGEAGHTTHLDAWEIDGGANIMKWMVEKVDRSDYMLFVCSPAYFNEEKRYSAMERLAALHYDPDGEKGFARLVVIKSAKFQD